MDPTVTAANEPLIQFLLRSQYAGIVGYYLIVRYACLELAPLIPAAWRVPTSRAFVWCKILDFLAGNYGNAKNAQAVGLLEGIAIRMLSGRGMTDIAAALMANASNIGSQRVNGVSGDVVGTGNKTVAQTIADGVKPLAVLLVVGLAMSLSACGQTINAGIGAFNSYVGSNEAATQANIQQADDTAIKTWYDTGALIPIGAYWRNAPKLHGLGACVQSMYGVGLDQSFAAGSAAK